MHLEFCTVHSLFPLIGICGTDNIQSSLSPQEYLGTGDQEFSALLLIPYHLNPPPPASIDVTIANRKVNRPKSVRVLATKRPLTCLKCLLTTLYKLLLVSKKSVSAKS